MDPEDVTNMTQHIRMNSNIEWTPVILGINFVAIGCK